VILPLHLLQRLVDRVGADGRRDAGSHESPRSTA
jgi:hypothetical protein